MPHCQAIKQSLDQCTAFVVREGMFCGIHERQHHRLTERYGPRQPGMCYAPVTQGRCEFPHEPDQLLCMHHRHVRERRIARQQEEAREQAEITDTYNQYMAHNPRLPWQEVLIELTNRMGLPIGFPGYISRTVAMQVGRRYFTTPENNPTQFQNERYYWRIWRWIREGGIDRDLPVPLPDDEPAPPPPPPRAPVPRLQALAGDAQNVHTREVSQQTNDSTALLLDVPVPISQKTEQTLVLSWYALPNQPSHYKILRTAVDINKWFNTDTCRQQGDKLYKHLLRGLVAYIGQISDPESRQELWRRAWEECDEAVGMCCEGHISRLCNVLVGFDDAFKPPVAFSEILQNKMAAIAGMDVSVDEKIQQANTFFNEYAIPQEQRQAWLEAFSQE